MPAAQTPLKNYDFKDGNILIIGTDRVGGFGADGGIEYEFASSIYEDESGADGQVTVSQLHDYRMYATVTVMETSASYRVLMTALTAQRRQLVKTPFPFAHRDQINGDQILVTTCVFLDWPTPSKSRVAGEREFRILLPDGAKNFSVAPTVSNLIP